MSEQKKTTEGIKEKSKAMENLIISWGLPECLESNRSNINFKFLDEGLVNTNGNSVKFCLYDEELEKVLFSMEFYKSSQKMQKLSPNLGVTLVLLYVHDKSLRKRGIASFYINRLREYAISEKVPCIQVKANANDIYFKEDNKQNALNQKDLEEFYLKRSTPEMPIKLIEF